MTSTRDLAIVAAHRLMGDCLAAALDESNDWHVSTAKERLGEVLGAGGAPADVVLIDLSLPQEGLADRLCELRRRWPRTKVLLLGPREIEESFLPLLEAGADGYQLHDCSIAELETTLEALIDGETPLPPRLAHAVFARLGELGRERLRQRQLEALVLTPREFQVLQLIAEDCSNRQTAERLHLSIHTVKNHVHNILDKLEVDNRGQAVEVAIRRRWLPERSFAGAPAALRSPDGVGKEER